MDKNYIADLIDRLRQSSTPPNLREEVVRALTHQRFLLEETYAAAKGGSSRAAEFISGVGLGKEGFGTPGDVGF
jgi:hypothetical protein